MSLNIPTRASCCARSRHRPGERVRRRALERCLRSTACASSTARTVAVPLRSRHSTACRCLSAPATLAQLDENLQALHDPALPDERRQLLLEQGAEVYREETLFRRLVRSR